jgi:hypothetical protein
MENELPLETPQPGTESNPETLETLIEKLHSDAEETRLAAVQALSSLTPAPVLSLRSLEKAAGQDASPMVRQAALAALSAPAFREAQRQNSHLPISLRQTILTEIDRWQADGLLLPPIAGLLRQRYRFDAPAAPAAPVPAQPAPTLSEVLLSEATIKVALYLGAFFVLAAAAILAALIDLLRLPILGVVTVGFLGAAIPLRWRLPQAGFALFIVFSFLLPIDAAVLLDMFNASQSLTQLYWIGVAVLLSAIWLGGTVFYSSRFFSVLTWLAAGWAALQVGNWFDLTPHFILFLIGPVILSALGGVVFLRRWRNRAFAQPLWWVSQFGQIALLGVSALMIMLTLFDDPLPAVGWWVIIGLTWLMGVAFYIASDRLEAVFPLFPWAAVVAALPVPLLWLQVISPSVLTEAVVMCGWGVILALTGEALARLPAAQLRKYALPVSLGGLAMLALAPIVGVVDRVAVSLGCLLAAAGLYLALTFYRPRWWTWSSALVAGTAAWFAIFALPSVQLYRFYPGFVLLWPALALIALHLVARRAFQAGPRWYLPPILWGGGVGLVAALYLLLSGVAAEPARAAIAWTITAGFAAAFALIDRRAWVGYGATGSLALAMVFGLLHYEPTNWLLPLLLPVIGYVLAGFGLALWHRFDDWAEMLRWSGLGLGVLVSLAAPIQGGATAVIGVAIVATAFAVEAWYRRNIWLGFPSALLYLGSYFILLVVLEVTEPQVYSIGAALLGFIMHYLLVRSGNSLAAFLTGLVSQLILLSTTYIQMLSTDRFLFFLVLFVQAMIVLSYGLVVRSRSLVGAPLAFVILGVITVTLGSLSGLPALALVGCTGFLLLLAGIAALLQRERLLTVSHRFSERLTGWQA